MHPAANRRKGGVLPALAVLLLSSSTASAQHLTHVRLRSGDAPALAQRLEQEGFDVLEGSVGPGALELVVSRTSRERLEERGFALEVIAEGRPFAQIQRERALREGGPEWMPPGYLTLAEILTEMSQVASAHPAIAQVVDVTSAFGGPPTWDGHPIVGMKISDNVAADEDEPSFLVVSDHHAREIVTPVIALHAIDQLTAGYGSDPAITAAVDGYEIWVVPVWNPDGYVYVFDFDNLWRKNRRDNGNGTWGVDLNRNYPFGWSSACSGSKQPSSDTYAGPSAASEPETQTMLAFGTALRFAKLHDYHSYASEVRYGYGCWTHPWNSFLKSEAVLLSQAGGYGGSTASSCCTAGNIHWHSANFGTHAFLWETHTQFQPSYQSAQAEAAKLWPGMLAMLQRPIPLSGHVLDACSGEPLEATISYLGVAFQNGETNGSGGPHGRYQAFLPPGSYTVRFSAPGYAPQDHAVVVGSSTAQVLDVALTPLAPAAVYCTAKTNSAGCTPAIAFAGVPSASATSGFTLGASGLLEGKSGLLFYGLTGPAAVPFQGGWLCVQPPHVRTPVQLSSGSPPCGGAYAIDFNAWIASGADPALVAGAQVWAQYWSRDPGYAPPANTGLTDAVQFAVCP
jgi:hypothetical protein